MLSSYAMTDVGRTRAVNQDYVFSCLEPVGNLPNLVIRREILLPPIV